jgi:hypothetical protein
MVPSRIADSDSRIFETDSRRRVPRPDVDFKAVYLSLPSGELGRGRGETPCVLERIQPRPILLRGNGLEH